MLLKFLIDNNGFRCINPSDASTATLVNYIKCHFDFKDSAFSEVDAIVAVFKSATYNKVSEVLLDSNNNCLIDPEVYKRGGTIQVTLIGDKYVDDRVVSSSHTSVVSAFYINEGIIIPTVVPSKYDVFVAELERASESVTDVIEHVTELVESGAFDGDDGVGIESVSYNEAGNVIITLSDGTSFVSEYSMKGAKGDAGEDGNYISDITYGQDGTLVISMSDGTQYVSEYSMKGEKGDKGDSGDRGDAGRGITSIVKTGTSGLVDTYTITYSDNTTSIFTVTNGQAYTAGNGIDITNGVISLDLSQAEGGSY